MKFLYFCRIFIFILAFVLVSQGVFAEPQIDATYEEEVLAEIGWLKYITVTVNNTGDSVLNNVIVTIEGGYDWFTIMTNKTSLNPGKTEEFLFKLDVPSEIEVGMYEFALFLKSDEITEQRSISILTFSSKKEMMQYQVGSLRSRLDVLREDVHRAKAEGKNVTEIEVSLEGATSILTVAEKYVDNEFFNDAVDKIKNVDYLIKEAEFELSIASEASEEIIDTENMDWSLIIIAFIVIIIVFISLRNKKLKGRRIGEVLKTSELRIKRFIMSVSGFKGIDEELKELKETQKLLDEEYKKKIISKESYDELSALNQEKILELQKKKKIK